jgi:nucleoside-diphosphate-sugar epimerase
VDKLGVINVAKACIDLKVKRLVIVSSGAVTKPLSPVYLLLNLVGKGIMKAKIDGENEVRRLYASLGPDSELGYTIIRPGGLTEEEPLGVKVRL